MFSFTLWTFIVLLSTAVRPSDEGQPHVIGSLQPVFAAPGDDVVLPCHLEPSLNVEGLTVEWSRPDLKPDPSDRLSRVEYVHLYRDRREVPDMKIRSYIRRTALFPERLKRGDISLKITNVTLADKGRYRCFIPKLKSQVKDSVVLLVVDPDSVDTPTTETTLHPRNLQTPDPRSETNVTGRRSHVILVVVVVACLLLILGVGAACFLRHRRRTLNHCNSDVDESKPLPA